MSTILADAQVTAKDLTVAKFLSHASNAILPTSKSAGELGNLVEQSSLTSSIRSARETLLSGAAASASIPAPGPSPLRSSSKDQQELKATQPYYTPKTGAVDEEDNATGSVSAPKADQPMAPEDLVEIDQVKLTFSLNLSSRKRVKKVLISGNIQELGMWAPKKAADMFQSARGDYEFELTLPSWRREFEYKYAVVEMSSDGLNEDFIWESGFIRKCKLDNSRLQKVTDSWEGMEGLEDFAPDQRGRSATEKVTGGKGAADDSQRGRASTGGSSSGGWRNAYRNA